MGKYKKIYNILNCPIDIPINDLNAWEKYPEYRWIYNKIILCEYQDIKCAPMPIEPDNYPVILKPIINLYGMGLNIRVLKNENDFYNVWYSNNFWMEFIEGEHYSYDLFIQNGNIKYTICFRGEKDELLIGKFKYWEYINKSIPKIILKLVSEKFSNYTGILNAEVINDKIIECHLRMGDIDIFPTLDILKGVIALYQNQEYNWNIQLPKVYFCPFWVLDNTDQSVQKYVEEFITPLLENNEYIHDFEINDLTMAGPGNFKRLLWVSCSDLDYVESIFISIRKIINNKFNL